ncbi:MAG: hypothetical protein A2Z02_03200 [Chloroflexi bacterium RBG_16_48_7]|nr:MAG: hypothetical protein A2Z02_03200 [Chloroflexi bacterium RBG_16_48_7]
MSKKAKRIRAMQQASKKPSAPIAEKPLRQVNTEIKPVASHNPRNSAVVQESQYKYIMPELIRIAIIAAVFFAIIIVLSFVVK